MAILNACCDCAMRAGARMMCARRALKAPASAVSSGQQLPACCSRLSTGCTAAPWLWLPGCSKHLGTALLAERCGSLWSHLLIPTACEWRFHASLSAASNAPLALTPPRHAQSAHPPPTHTRHTHSPCCHLAHLSALQACLAPATPPLSVAVPGPSICISWLRGAASHPRGVTR